MKRSKWIVSGILAALLLVALNVMPVMAASVYTPLAGTKYTITEKLYLEHSDTIVPEVTYKLELVNTVPTTQAGGTVPTGAVTGEPTVTTDEVSFNASSTVYGHGGNYGRHVQGNFVIDFTTVTFHEPGIYRYDLTKAMTTDVDTSKIKNNRATDYILVYVASDENSNTLKAAVYVRDDKDETVNGNSINKEYEDRYRSVDHQLMFQKTVRGNAGSRSQYFEFTVTLTGGVPGAKYEVEGSYQDTTEITTSNTETKNNVTLLGVKEKVASDPEGTPDKYIELDEDGNYTGKVWLRHNQSVTINDLAEGISYSVTEASVDYTQTLSDTSDAATGVIPATTNEGDDIELNFINTKTIEVPTGINLNVAAPMFGILLVGLLLMVLMVSKRREDY